MTREYVIEVDDIDLNLVKEIYLEDVKAFFKINGELIRCKDCKYYIGDKSIPRGMYCELLNWRSFADEYCSLGERKKDE